MCMQADVAATGLGASGAPSKFSAAGSGVGPASAEAAARWGPTRGRGSNIDGMHASRQDEDIEDMRPTAFQQVQSRAEDIVCLRNSRQYVTRQQMPMSGSSNGGSTKAAPPPPPPPAAVASPPSIAPPSGSPPGAGNTVAAAPSDSQKELIHQLLNLAVKQINSVNASIGKDTDTPKGTSRDAEDTDVAKTTNGDARRDLPPPSNPNVQGTPRKGAWDSDLDSLAQASPKLPHGAARRSEHDELPQRYQRSAVESGRDVDVDLTGSQRLGLMDSEWLPQRGSTTSGQGARRSSSDS